MSLNYAGDIRNTGSRYSRPDGWADAEWHKSAIADSGASHTLPGRLYIVQCEWCPEAFAANTKADAMSMFREHEAALLEENGGIAQ